MERADATSPEGEDSALEETAREQLGVESWDRPLIFRETAEAATDIRLPYWSMLVLSGAIATLGLALDNAAVVIGAMLIAPLLAPTMGLALALAMGDVRLAAHTGVAVVVSTCLVIVTATVLTFALPVQTFTSEITARTRPTTLDLGIAVFSGLAGAVASVTRRKGLSAAIPGVAVAVAVIPPLAVAGFSAGAGFRWSFIKGSMLLYGANLAGIVFSGTIVFLLIGMHREEVVEAARMWHRKAVPTRLAAWAERSRWFPALGSIRTPAARISLVLTFVVALAVPLTITLTEIVRETRVQRAVSRASSVFDVEGRSSVLSVQPVFGDGESQAMLRVATTEWFGGEAREAFERMASEEAGEPVRLILEQMPASSGDLEQLAGLFPQRQQRSAENRPEDLVSLLARVRERLETATGGLTLPEGAEVLGTELLMGSAAQRGLRVGYAADVPFTPEIQRLLARQIKQALSTQELDVRWDHVVMDTLAITGTAADTTALREIAGVLNGYRRLQVTLAADTSGALTPIHSTLERLMHFGLERERIHVLHTEENRILIIPHSAERTLRSPAG